MSNFVVKVDKMIESHRTTYWVVLLNMDIRPKDAKFWDSVGKITPYYTEILSQANETAEEWAEFLDVKAELYHG